MPAERFEAFRGNSIRSRFKAAIVRSADGVRIGALFLSSEDAFPDLAIMLYAPFRRMGYVARTFALGATYCFDALKLDSVYAGCYADNLASMRMLQKCGFLPHP